MAVVVDDDAAIGAVAAQHETGSSERSESDDTAGHAIGGNVNGREVAVPRGGCRPCSRASDTPHGDHRRHGASRERPKERADDQWAAPFPTRVGLTQTMRQLPR
jgi:hypothetical protein